MIDAHAADADLNHLIADNSIVRVHQHGSAKNRSGNPGHGYFRGED